jgi:threonine dehydrogenase-like Zn-dependent dehydrogenase
MYGRNITLKLGRVHARAHMCQTLELMEKGSLKPEQAITKRAPFSEAAEVMLEPENKIVFLAGT